MSTNAVFYHDNCCDGLLAVAIWHHHHPDGFFQAVQYRRIPELQDRFDNVTFLDFTPPLEWVQENLANIGNLTILDHHKSALGDIDKIASLIPNATIVFDMSRSGGVIAWDYLENKVLPPLVQIAGDYDLGKPLGDNEGFVDIFAHWLTGDDVVRFTEFYQYVTQTDPVSLGKEFDKCRLVNQMREQKIRWFEQKLKYHKAKLAWIEGEPEIDIAYTFCPHYLITSFSKWVVTNNPNVNVVVGVSISDKSLGFSFRGRHGESYCREIAEHFGGGGHDSAAGGYLNHVVGFHRLNELIIQGGKPKDVPVDPVR